MKIEQSYKKLGIDANFKNNSMEKSVVQICYEKGLKYGPEWKQIWNEFREMNLELR